MVKYVYKSSVVFISPMKYFNGLDAGYERYVKFERINSLGLVSIVDNDCLKHTYYSLDFDAQIDKPFIDIFLGE